MANKVADPFPRILNVTPRWTVLNGSVTLVVQADSAVIDPVEGPVALDQLSLRIYTPTRVTENDYFLLELPAGPGANAALTQEETSGYQTVRLSNFPVARTGSSPTGLANNGTAYTAAVVIDGGASQPISVVGSASQTFTTLLSEINNDITGAVASLVNGNIVIISDATGASSTVAITDTSLFSSLTDFLSIQTAVAGLDEGALKEYGDAGITAHFYGTTSSGAWHVTIPSDAEDTITIVDGVGTVLLPPGTIHVYVEVTGSDDVDTYFSGDNTFTNFGDTTGTVGNTLRYPYLVGTMRDVFNDGKPENTRVLDDDDANAVSLFVLGGANSSTIDRKQFEEFVRIVDVPTSVLVNVGGAKAGATATGLANNGTAYTATVTVNGDAQTVSVVGSAAQTYTTLLAEINNDLTGVTASLSGGNIVYTVDASAATGTGEGQSLKVVDSGSNLLHDTLTDFVAIGPRVSDLTKLVATVGSPLSEKWARRIFVDDLGAPPTVSSITWGTPVDGTTPGYRGEVKVDGSAIYVNMDGGTTWKSATLA